MERFHCSYNAVVVGVPVLVCVGVELLRCCLYGSLVHHSVQPGGHLLSIEPLNFGVILYHPVF